MKTWIVDQFEFDCPGSEEALEINFAKKSEFPFPNVKEFAASCIGVNEAGNLGHAVPFDKVRFSGEMRKYLSQFTDIDLPKPCEWPAYWLTEDPDEHHILLSGPDYFIRYLWTSSA